MGIFFSMFFVPMINIKSNFKILNETQTEYRSDEGCKLQRVLNVDRTTPKMITLYCINVRCILNALNKLFQ